MSLEQVIVSWQEDLVASRIYCRKVFALTVVIYGILVALGVLNENHLLFNSMSSLLMQFVCL